MAAAACSLGTICEKKDGSNALMICNGHGGWRLGCEAASEHDATRWVTEWTGRRKASRRTEWGAARRLSQTLVVVAKTLTQRRKDADAKTLTTCGCVRGAHGTHIRQIGNALADIKVARQLVQAEGKFAHTDRLNGRHILWQKGNGEAAMNGTGGNIKLNTTNTNTDATTYVWFGVDVNQLEAFTPSRPACRCCRPCWRRAGPGQDASHCTSHPPFTKNGRTGTRSRTRARSRTRTAAGTPIRAFTHALSLCFVTFHTSSVQVLKTSLQVARSAMSCSSMLSPARRTSDYCELDCRRDCRMAYRGLWKLACRRRSRDSRDDIAANQPGVVGPGGGDAGEVGGQVVPAQVGQVVDCGLAELRSNERAAVSQEERSCKRGIGVGDSRSEFHDPIVIVTCSSNLWQLAACAPHSALQAVLADPPISFLYLAILAGAVNLW